MNTQTRQEEADNVDIADSVNEEVEKADVNFLENIIIKLGNLLSYLFLFTVAISFYEIVMRYLFNSPTKWVHESATFIGGFLFVYGGIYVLARDSHVRVVLIYDNVGETVKKYLNIFHQLMGMAFSGLLAYGAYNMAYGSWVKPWGAIQLERTGSAWDPAFPAYLKAIIFIVFCIMFVQLFLRLIAEIKSLRK